MGGGMGKFPLVLLAIASLVSLPCYDCRVLPKTYEICYRKDPHLQKCLTNEANRVLKQFTKGIPEIGIVPTDPFELGDFEVFPKTKTLYLTQQNGVLKGMRNAKIRGLIIDPVKLTGYLNIVTNGTLAAQYEVGGQLLIFPISGKGDSLIKLKNFDVKIYWSWSVFIGKDGKEYVRMNDYKFEYDFDDVKFKMTGLFNNNKVLGDAMTRIINENARSLMNELGKPAIDLVIQRMIKVINHFYSKVPYEEMLPDV